jgi:glycerol-3-phosphate acyltransferase PlsY
VTAQTASLWDVAWPLAAAAALGYLLGSIPFGWILTRLAGAGDIRDYGSGNIGATNVLRTGRKGIALLTLICDGGKGALAVAIAANLGDIAALAAGFAAVVGHLFPVWLRFAGGKGVATGLGVLLAAAPFAGLGACATWLLVAAAFRYSSLAALVAYALAPLFAVAFYDFSRAVLAAAVAVLVILRHRGNIARLAAGTEPHIGEKR